MDDAPRGDTPPTFDGDIANYKDWRRRAELWLYSTRADANKWAPRLLGALVGSAWEACKHLSVAELATEVPGTRSSRSSTSSTASPRTLCSSRVSRRPSTRRFVAPEMMSWRSSPRWNTVSGSSRRTATSSSHHRQGLHSGPTVRPQHQRAKGHPPPHGRRPRLRQGQDLAASSTLRLLEAINRQDAGQDRLRDGSRRTRRRRPT